MAHENRAKRNVEASVRFATFNIRYGTAPDGPNHWDKRKGILIDAVRAMDPDVMGVQESLPFQGDEIKMHVPHLDRVGVGRYHSFAIDRRPHESLSGEHCDIWYDTRRYLVETCGTFWHSDTPDMPGSISWGNSLARITTWAVLRSRETGVRFAFFNTHFHGNEPYVTKTTSLMIERIRRLARVDTGEVPIVLVGDFNLTPDSRSHALFTGAGPDGLGLRDVWQHLGKPEQDAGSCHDWDGKPKGRIDWILAGRGLTPITMERSSFQHNGRYPSDHFPLVAELAPTGTPEG